MQIFLHQDIMDYTSSSNDDETKSSESVSCTLTSNIIRKIGPAKRAQVKRCIVAAGEHGNLAF
jgi:predicted metal-dependent HD superfamily phosphohydrolase